MRPGKTHLGGRRIEWRSWSVLLPAMGAAGSGQKRTGPQDGAHRGSCPDGALFVFLVPRRPAFVRAAPSPTDPRRHWSAKRTILRRHRAAPARSRPDQGTGAMLDPASVRLAGAARWLTFFRHRVSETPRARRRFCRTRPRRVTPWSRPFHAGRAGFTVDGPLVHRLRKMSATTPFFKNDFSCK